MKKQGLLRGGWLIAWGLALMGTIHAAWAGSPDRRRDCALCPLMVEMPRGPAAIGAAVGEGDSDEFVFADGQPDPVLIQHRFSLSRSEVTRGEFAAFVRATGYETTAEKHNGCSVFLPNAPMDHQRVWHWRSPGFRQQDSHPVVCVSWLDAQAYVQWLSRSTGRQYRLPSEAEFEMAARRPRGGRFGVTDDPLALCRFANVADSSLKARQHGWTVVPCRDGFHWTAPVASFAPNALGLHDLTGNVNEWVADCYHPRHGRYIQTPSGTRRLMNDGRARTDSCPRPMLRVFKGGSWAFPAESQRVAWRGKEAMHYARNDLGFRVALDEASASRP